MAGIVRSGIRAYQQDLQSSEKAALNEPDQLVDEFAQRAEALDRPQQPKETLKHLIGTDLRHQMPPQMYAIVASLAKLIEAVDEGTAGEGKSQHV